MRALWFHRRPPPFSRGGGGHEPFDFSIAAREGIVPWRRRLLQQIDQGVFVAILEPGRVEMTDFRLPANY